MAGMMREVMYVLLATMAVYTLWTFARNQAVGAAEQVRPDGSIVLSPPIVLARAN